MTGITKDELMQMAEGSGVFHCASKFGFHSDAFNTSLEYLSNAILERAAAECDSQEGVANKHAKIDFVEAQASWRSWAAASQMNAKRIRALKINTGD